MKYLWAWLIMQTRGHWKRNCLVWSFYIRLWCSFFYIWDSTIIIIYVFLDYLNVLFTSQRLCAIHLSMYTLQCVNINKEHTHQHLLIYVGFCHPPCQAISVIYGRLFPKIMWPNLCEKCSLLCTIHLFMSLLLFHLCYLLVSSSVIRSSVSCFIRKLPVSDQSVVHFRLIQINNVLILFH